MAKRKQRLYAPFFKKSKDDKRWTRATYTGENGNSYTYTAMTKEFAVRHYQNWLLAPSLEGVNEIRELRPIKTK